MLTPKQIAFVDEYLRNDRNATAAYIRAGYSPKGANGHAARLVAKGSVAAEIARRTEAYTRAAGIDAVWVLERMKNIADADLSRVFDDKGALIPPRLWPDDLKRCIASVKVVELAGGMEIGGEAGIKHVPMFTKEVKLEARVPVLAKLLDWIDAKPTPPAQRRFAADWIRTSE